MESKKKAITPKEKSRKPSTEHSKQSTSELSKLPSTSKDVFKMPKTPVSRRSDAGKYNEGAEQKKKRLSHEDDKASDDEDVLIIDVSAEEIAEIFEGQLVDEEPKENPNPDELEKTAEDIAKEELERELENLQGILVDKYVEASAEERMSPEFQRYTTKSYTPPKPPKKK